MTDYFPIVFFPILYFAAKFVMRVHPVKADDMDFITNVAEFDRMTYVIVSFSNSLIDHAHRYDDPPPKNWLQVFWMWFVRTATTSPFHPRAHQLSAIDIM